MAFQNYKLPSSSLLFTFLLLLVSAGASGHGHHSSSDVSRKSFPASFVFGTASASYQYEGGASEGGRTPSIWDTYTHKHPERIADGSNGDVAVDSYHRYKEDVSIMKKMGLEAYRFSISWSRVLPSGRPSGGINKVGAEYYNNLINELLANNIQPYVTLFHWDLPQTLEDEYGGFLSSRIVEDFKNYAEVCFKEFGDRVKHWITLNEPWTYSSGGYAGGTLAPGRCSEWQNLNCTGGDSGTEPYLVGHHQLLAHAAVVELYRHKYQEHQKGKIGITLVCHWMIPYSNAKHNKNAAIRSLDFMFGWFMDPLTFGDYPRSMRSLVAERLPKFTRKQAKLVKGSFDFIGLNYYTTYYSAYTHLLSTSKPSYVNDARVNQTGARNGIPIGPQPRVARWYKFHQMNSSDTVRTAASSWLFVYPRGFYDLLMYTRKKYNNPLIYITENGISDANNANISVEEALADHMRVDYYREHLSNLSSAIEAGVNVKGYFAWSLLDNFEWFAGYTVRFGINYVDYENGLKRYPKLSAKWFKTFLKK